ncbi:DUF6115 domain-containing protein [Jeotgalibacillus sp. R-1-5s-1]|uniref:DUF6115 domain-containing protein n=1 Tax=Jeotgalibacillus sp. R-1-5s-1 TaxID=2555897 RepID=UPI00106C1F6C|nr:hypothetical protein [Jeotgalibacillus sp. R-1-5s-1]TFE03473.1 hypothetical protein E2491_01390 [Jeotgalibacillus sp. R-1-5s-1]
MILFLLILSLLFNIAAFLSIYLLFMRQNRLIDKEVQHERALNEIEQTFTAYLLEIKEENEVFLKQFETLQSKQAVTGAVQPAKAVKQTEQEVSGSLISKTAKKMAVSSYQSSLPQETAPAEKTPAEQAVLLKQQGLSIADIAKKLNKGKTEVELMIKFSQNAK